MPWSTEDKIEYLLQLPWTIVPSQEDQETVLRVREIPSVVVSGTDQAELERDFWDSLRASLGAYLHFDDPLPRPGQDTRLFPWEDGWRPIVQRRTTRILVTTGRQLRIEEDRSSTTGSGLQSA